MPVFRGFGAATFAFLDELAANNERAWFQANRERYEREVLDPSLDFIATIAPRLERISGHFLAIPKRQGGSLMRVHRDTRFAKEKVPYKTNVGIQFRHEQGKDVHAPGYYVHLEPGRCFLGAGMWHPEPAALQAVRERIVARPKDWAAAIGGRAFRATFELGGDALKRVPRGFAADAPHVDDVKRKDFIAVADFDSAEAASAGFCADVAKRFDRASPLMRFLCQAAGVPF